MPPNLVEGGAWNEGRIDGKGENVDYRHSRIIKYMLTSSTSK